MAFYIIANWKMNEGKPHAEAYIRTLTKCLKDIPRSRTIVICPPFTQLSRIAYLTRGTRIRLGAQDVSSEPGGAFTGDISASMLSRERITHVIVGHSERRRFHHESEGMIRKKLVEVFKHGLVPILCIGETKDERQKRRTRAVLERQLLALKGVSLLKKRLIVAYEPVWAISTSKKREPLHPERIPTMLKDVRALALARVTEGKKLSELSVIYGGSVDHALAKNIVGNRDVNGFLIGSSSLDPKRFISIATL